MQYSLCHRFQGALLGTALGEALGLNCHRAFNPDSTPSQPSIPWLTVRHWGFAVPTSTVSWSRIAVRQVEAFKYNGDAGNGKQGNSSGGNTNQGNGSESHVMLIPGSLPPNDPIPLSGLAIATLPIALFYHEDWYRLRESLEQTASAWKIACPITSTLVVAYTIALALRERLHLDTLIPRLITDLELYDRDPQLMQQLNQVQTWVNHKVGIAIAKSQVQTSHFDSVEATPVAIALYGFLSTPANFQLSLLRTAQMLQQPQEACAIVAALSGAYNGIAGIPLSWRRALDSANSLSNLLPQLNSEAELLQQADLLWAIWSGASDPVSWLQHSFQPTIASPHLIRPLY